MSVTTRGAPQERIRDHGARVLRIPPPLYYGAAFAAGIMLRAVSVPLAIVLRVFARRCERIDSWTSRTRRPPSRSIGR
jgi:hypothetical protein